MKALYIIIIVLTLALSNQYARDENLEIWQPNTALQPIDDNSPWHCYMEVDESNAGRTRSRISFGLMRTSKQADAFEPIIIFPMKYGCVYAWKFDPDKKFVIIYNKISGEDLGRFNVSAMRNIVQ